MKGKVMGVIGTLLVAAGVVISSVAGSISNNAPNLDPTVNLSAVRYIWCHNPKKADPNMGWTGSGSIVGKGIVLTALHVADGDHCYDIASERPLTLYASDKKHDLAFMRGDLPATPVIKMSCQPYKKGQTYIAYGVSNYMRPDPLFRMNVLVANKHRDVTLEDGSTDKGIETFTGPVVPGMSGGPVVDLDGYVHGVVSIGDQDELGFPTKFSGSYELKGSSFCP